MTVIKPTALPHFVNGQDMRQECPAHCLELLLGMGCFWGVERKLWALPGVVVTASGYAGGTAANPSYESVCTGSTSHTEVVRVIYDPSILSTDALLQVFWESHDPTQGMRQGNDQGSQYRSAIYCTTDVQLAASKASKAVYQSALSGSGLGTITTEIDSNKTFYLAETYHQQYLAKNPNGYCGLKGTGVSCVI